VYLAAKIRTTFDKAQHPIVVEGFVNLQYPVRGMTDALKVEKAMSTRSKSFFESCESDGLEYRLKHQGDSTPHDCTTRMKPQPT
jgi:translation elongation factor EF-G